MSLILRFGCIAGACTILTACGGASTSGNGMDVIPEPFELPATFRPVSTPASVTNLQSQLRAAQNAERTKRSEILPRGTATYAGAASLTLSTNFPELDEADLIGHMSATADLFLSGDDFSGRITGIHTVDDAGAPVDALQGELNLTGTLDDGTKRVSGGVNGTLSGYFGTETLMTATFNDRSGFAGSTGDLFGVTRPGLFGPTTPEFEAATISGTVDATGGVKFGQENVTAELDGTFGITDIRF